MSERSSRIVPADRLAPFTVGDGDTGILVVHGFTGTPHDMRDLALALADRGWRVANVLLAGHAAGEAALAQTRWPDWWESLVAAYVALRSHCSRIMVCGFSMGGVLALKLCVHYPVVGAAILAAPVFMRGPLLPFLPCLSRFVRYRPHGPPSVTDPEARARQPDVGRTPLVGLASFVELMADVDELLPEVSSPLLLVYSRRDHIVPFANLAHIAGRVGSRDVESCVLERSDHVLTVDLEHQRVTDAVLSFATRVGGGAA
jgi:carboxylesterase